MRRYRPGASSAALASARFLFRNAQIPLVPPLSSSVLRRLHALGPAPVVFSGKEWGGALGPIWRSKSAAFWEGGGRPRRPRGGGASGERVCNILCRVVGKWRSWEEFAYRAADWLFVFGEARMADSESPFATLNKQAVRFPPPRFQKARDVSQARTDAAGRYTIGNQDTSSNAHLVTPTRFTSAAPRRPRNLVARMGSKMPE